MVAVLISARWLRICAQVPDAIKIKSFADAAKFQQVRPWPTPSRSPARVRRCGKRVTASQPHVSKTINGEEAHHGANLGPRPEVGGQEEIAVK